MATSSDEGWITAFALIGVAVVGAVLFWPGSSDAAAMRQPSPLPLLGQNASIDRSVILVLQRQLVALGYPTAINGRIGTDTRVAITMFSQDHHISLSGPDTDRIIAVDQAYANQFEMPD